MNGIKEKFTRIYNKMVENNEMITSKYGKDTFYPAEETELFEQIYVPIDEPNVRYSLFRSVFPQNYFINKKGILLKLNKNGQIKLIENANKGRDRRFYKIPLSHPKKKKNIYDYQLIAIVFESSYTEYGDYLLRSYGIDALNMGLEIHHIKGLDEQSIENLQIMHKDEHDILGISRLNDEKNSLKQLQKASKTFKGNTNLLIITDNSAPANNPNDISKKNKYSKIHQIIENDIDGKIRNELNIAIPIIYNDILVLIDKKHKIAYKFDNESNKYFQINDTTLKNIINLNII